jgi:hypothetical protein
MSQMLMEYLKFHNISISNKDDSALLKKDLLQVILSQNISRNSLNNSEDNNNKLDNCIFNDEAINDAQTQNRSSLPNKQKANFQLKKNTLKYNRINYRWDPKWLRTFRKRICMPIAIITLFLLFFTNLSSNWIYIDGINDFYKKTLKDFRNLF